MFNWFKKKVQNSKESEALEQSGNYQFKWYDIGEGNPFNKRILDIRSFTQTMVATTKEKSIAEKYNKLRGSTGEEYVGANIEGGLISKANLRYPHNGAALRGAAFKSDSMDCKWDIYAYDNYFYFTRSWTGELVYRALVAISSDTIIITEIEHPKTIDPGDAVSNVHFLIISHATGRPFPHKVPVSITDEKEIALYSFSQFGNRACYACYEDVTDIVVSIK